MKRAATATSRRRDGVARLLPCLDWMRGYRRADFASDAIAGVITAIVLVPQGMAFALLAGLPPQVGLYTSILPPLAYAVFGTSRTLAVGPVSVAALMVAHALRDAPPGLDAAMAAAILAVLAGAVLLAMGALRLGVIETVLSHPVLAGFTTAAAILILANQLPALLGAPGAAVHDIFTQVGAAPGAALPGVACAAVLWIMGDPLRRWLTRSGIGATAATTMTRAAPLAIVVLSTLVVLAVPETWEMRVPQVGAIPGGLPALAWPRMTVDHVRALAAPAALIGLVSYVESLSIAKALAARRRERIDANRELVAIGASNIASALGGGMPVAGGFSRTMVNFQAGARTQGAAIVTALLVALVTALFTPLLAHVPKAALAAIVILAVVRLIDVPAIRALWRYDRVDGAVFAVTAVAVLALNIEEGIAAGIVASLAGFALRNARPHIAILGRLRGTEHFRNVQRHEVETWPHVLFVRPDENLTFANAGFVESWLTTAVGERPDLRHLVLVMSSVNAIDSTGLERLERLAENLHEGGVTLHLTDVKGPLMDRLVGTTLFTGAAPLGLFLSAHEAARTLEHL
jgi:SulP family sulfate permease